MALTGALLLAAGACTAGGHDRGSGASCAGDISIDGARYIGGRGDGATPVPHDGTVLHGTVLPCADGDFPSRPVVAHTIPGVQVTDAVAGPDTYQVMLAEPLWEKPWSSLPAALQPYVRP
jgi:hypothetical protein